MTFEEVKDFVNWSRYIPGSCVDHPLFYYKEPNGRMLFLYANLSAWERYSCWEVPDWDLYEDFAPYYDDLEEVIFGTCSDTYPNLLETEEKDYLLGLDWKLFNKAMIQAELTAIQKRLTEFSKKVEETEGI